MIQVRRIFQTLAELQGYLLYFIEIRQLTISHMLQDQFPNEVQKLSKVHHALQEYIQHISGC